MPENEDTLIFVKKFTSEEVEMENTVMDLAFQPVRNLIKSGDLLNLCLGLHLTRM